MTHHEGNGLVIPPYPEASHLVASVPLLKGEVIGDGHYEILGRLSSGSQAKVYTARSLEEKVRKKVVVKVFEPSSEWEGELEAAAHAELNGESNITPTMDMGELEQNGWLHRFAVMPLISGGSLASQIETEKRSFDEASALNMMKDVVRAARHFKEKGLVHRDIKPANILRARAGWVLADFGLVEVLDTPRGDEFVRAHLGEVAVYSMRARKPALVRGTFPYLAPEAILEGTPPSSKLDVFSMGGVLFYVLAGGRVPFPRADDPTLSGPEYREIVNEGPVSITTYLKDASPEVVAILDGSLNPDPAKRYDLEELDAGLHAI